MPTYEYSCPKCGNFDLVQKISEEALKSCPTCGAEVKRLIAATAFHLKGTGWYKTDYSSSGSGSSAPASGSATKTTSSTETSPTPATSEGSSSSGSSGSGSEGGSSDKKACGSGTCGCN